ncbi:hypothetical protein [Candidatus Enterococcus courvalinii]|uniref:Uncharacterized protein n=1 Tax=Candidatus Enterococcus courvalinii TaxID=2815329 RepID=A0ABS3I0U4_9ENTE|nr:hypothetical protein [Enterococcus sp. MSG2901]MBO0482342.1 hypothetical protein [Enterococcus sp. MSG2901]
MKIKFTRKTGFYGMGSAIRLQINGQSIYLNQQDSVEVEVAAPLTMQASFFWLKSPVYHIALPKDAYVITMNLLLLQLYPVLFFFTSLSAIYFSNLFYSLVAVIGMIGFFFFIKNQAYVIKEDTSKYE